MNVAGNLGWLTKSVGEAVDAIRVTLPDGCPPIPREAAETLAEVIIATSHNGHLRWMAGITTKRERGLKRAKEEALGLIYRARYLHRECFRVMSRTDLPPETRELWRGATVAALIFRQAAQESFPEAWAELEEESDKDPADIWGAEMVDVWKARERVPS